MPLTRSDLGELVFFLFGGLQTDAPWDVFLTRLIARSGADRAILSRTSSTRRIVASGWVGPAPDELAAIGGPPAALRPNRVYALEELRNVESKDAREVEGAALAAARIGDARLIRIKAGDDPIWLVLIAEKTAFSAADSALLSDLAPAIAIAAALLDGLASLRRRAEAAESSLALLGIGQAVLGPTGEVLASDPLWRSRQPKLPGPPELGQGANSRAVAQAADGTPVLLRTLEGASETVASFRVPRRESADIAAAILVSTLGLSPREASVAALLSQGVPLVEAGRSLNLTDETTRNYSKRIYAKTGARNQADLVRIVLSGLATLG